MHSPDELTLPLMVQSGEGATSPEAEAIRMAWALSGTFTLPRIVVFLLRTRQSHGAMNAPCHMPLFASPAAVGGPEMTGPALALNMLDQLVARGNAAGPALALGVEAELVDRGRVDA